jgi:transcriptional regulator with XRE-family HTH domain
VHSLENLANNLRRLRGAAGLTQERLAEQAGVEYKYYQKIEAATIKGIRLSTIQHLAKVLKVDAWQLICPVSSKAKKHK